MIENKYRTIGEVVLVMGLLIVGGIALVEEKAYYCEVRGLTMNCDDFSKYYGLENGKCINEDIGNRLCRSGWTKMSDLLEKDVVGNEMGNATNILVNANNKEWSCPIDNNKLTSYTNCFSGEYKGYLGELI